MSNFINEQVFICAHVGNNSLLCISRWTHIFICMEVDVCVCVVAVYFDRSSMRKRYRNCETYFMNGLRRCRQILLIKHIRNTTYWNWWGMQWIYKYKFENLHLTRHTMGLHVCVSVCVCVCCIEIDFYLKNPESVSIEWVSNGSRCVNDFDGKLIPCQNRRMARIVSMCVCL